MIWAIALVQLHIRNGRHTTTTTYETFECDRYAPCTSLDA